MMYLITKVQLIYPEFDVVWPMHPFLCQVSPSALLPPSIFDLSPFLGHGVKPSWIGADSGCPQGVPWCLDEIALAQLEHRHLNSKFPLSQPRWMVTSSNGPIVAPQESMDFYGFPQGKTHNVWQTHHDTSAHAVLGTN